MTYGVLYETGSGKFLRFTLGNTQFRSSWEDATLISKDQYLEEKHVLLDVHNVDWYAATVVWFPIKDEKIDYSGKIL